MADEHQFIENGLQRAQIDEFFGDELSRAGYGGMDIAKTPMGTQIVLKAEKPGMVIGKGGKNIRKITTELTERFGMDDPQIDVQEVDEPDLNARIVADRLANALERGWYFRKAGHTTIDRIMDAGALGAEIVLSGKVTGARGRVEKFNRGYIKHNGEPAQEIVDHGQAVSVMKLGTIGVTVKIIPPGARLPDDFRIHDEADTSGLVAEPIGAGEDISDALDKVGDELGEVEGAVQGAGAETGGEVDEGVVEEELVEGDEPVEAGAVDEEVVEEVAEEVEADESEALDEDVEAEAARIVAEMEADDGGED